MFGLMLIIAFTLLFMNIITTVFSIIILYIQKKATVNERK